MEYLGIPFSVKNVPCLQPDFLPFAPWRTAYLSQARQPFRIAVEGSGTVVYETRIRGGFAKCFSLTSSIGIWSAPSSCCCGASEAGG